MPYRFPDIPVNVEYITSDVYEDAAPVTDDPFRHQASTNSHNHHELHEWGEGIEPGTKEFDSRYAEAHYRFRYHAWYRRELFQYVATELIAVMPISEKLVTSFQAVVKTFLESGTDAALESAEGQEIMKSLKETMDRTDAGPSDELFVRLGSGSAKDSFEPGIKPTPVRNDPEVILCRLLASSRCVGSLLALADSGREGDPGEAVIIQRWSRDLEPSRELRVFVHDGRITAISQEVWCEQMGWRNRYSDALVPAIEQLWGCVENLVNFRDCAMDVLVTPPRHRESEWEALIIDFNAFGAHLNTGSRLFHWASDYGILHGRMPIVVVRFVDDSEVPRNGRRPWEGNRPREPDWELLEKKVRENYSPSEKSQERLEMEKNTKLPRNGNWCGED